MIKSVYVIFVFILASVLSSLWGQTVPYGNNPEAGNYFDADGAKLYYEIYGEGDPIVMLHGGIFGYISEFQFLIPKLAESHRVICLATRGHGKSEIGHDPITQEQKVDDVYRLIKHLNLDTVTLIGFSDGSFTALKTAAMYPDHIKKVVAMGVGDSPKENAKDAETYSAESLLSRYGDFFKERLKLMPEPDRWDACLQMYNKFYKTTFMSEETFSQVKCPVLVMNGENDNYFTIDETIKCYKSLPDAQLAIIPGCHHVIFYCNFPAVWECMKGFLK